MNTRETGQLSPDHIARWLEVSQKYLATPVTELFSDEVIEGVTRTSISMVRGGQSVLLSWAQRALLHLLRRAAQGEGNPLKVLEKGFKFHVSLMAKHPLVPKAILSWYAKTSDARVRLRIQNTVGHYQRRLSKLIVRAKQQGLVKANIDAQIAADLLVGLLQSLVVRMDAGTIQPEMLLRQAGIMFSAYLDCIRVDLASGHGTVNS